MLKPTVTSSEETAPLLRESVMAAHIITKANEDMPTTVIGIDSDATDYKPLPTSMSVHKQPSNRRSKSEHGLADLYISNKLTLRQFLKIA